MTILLTIIHVLVCFILILVVLAQQGKGQDLASAFGGGGTAAAFGARGAATFLSKLTTVAAIVFMLTSLGLTYFRPAVSERTVVPDVRPAEAPAGGTQPRGQTGAPAQEKPPGQAQPPAGEQKPGVEKPGEQKPPEPPKP